MATLIGKVARGSKKAVTKAWKEAETRVLAAEGRRSLEKKTAVARAVTKKAAKTGLMVGALAAAAVVAREVRKRRVPT